MSTETRLPEPATRRQDLMEDMIARAEQGHHCAACSGVCCTFVANSMKISPVEARDLRLYLEQEERWTPELLQELQSIVTRFRLDREVGDGRRSLRKTYTCPFYRPGPKGCSISRKHKPYGCLAFSPRAAGLTEGGNCASAQNLLENRAKRFPGEEPENLRLKALWNWDQETLPIPLALLQTGPVSSA